MWAVRLDRLEPADRMGSQSMTPELIHIRKNKGSRSYCGLELDDQGHIMACVSAGALSFSTYQCNDCWDIIAEELQWDVTE